MSDTQLQDRWRDAAWSLAGIFPPILIVVQSLGRVDQQPRATDREIGPFAARHEDPPLLDLTLHYAQSYLWVLGAYEITRTVASHQPLFSPNDYKSILSLKNSFARLRMPLAKLEPARRHQATDYVYPQPAFGYGRGAEWEVSPGALISRSHLADSLLDVFSNIRHAQQGNAQLGPAAI